MIRIEIVISDKWRKIMKDRLISVADLLNYLGLEDTEENREENVGVILTLEDIENISTAYNVDKGL